MRLTAFAKRRGRAKPEAGYSLAPVCAVLDQEGETLMLNNIGLPGLLLIAVVVLVLFGRGKISSLMGEVGKGITSFKKGINEGQAELEQDAADEAKDVTPDSEKDKA